jgi:hypothetical protein
MRVRFAVMPVLAVCIALAAVPALAASLGPIDDYAYDHARKCVKKPAKGALALQDWLARNSAGVSWGIMRCERLSGKNFSLHAEGRAIDWHLDARVPSDRRAADRLIRRLLAADSEGNPHALARRMGVQEIIWDCRSWFGGGWGDEQRLERYSPCYGRKGRPVKIDDTTAHRDHVHLGLTRRGAKRLTSFWTRTAPPASVAEAAPGA